MDINHKQRLCEQNKTLINQKILAVALRIETVKYESRWQQLLHTRSVNRKWIRSVRVKSWLATLGTYYLLHSVNVFSNKRTQEWCQMRLKAGFWGFSKVSIWPDKVYASSMIRIFKSHLIWKTLFRLMTMIEYNYYRCLYFVAFILVSWAYLVS